MITNREAEIRSNSLDIAVETYSVANLISTPAHHELRTQLIDSAFNITSNIAGAYNALQDHHFEAQIALALDNIDSIISQVQTIISEGLLESKKLLPLLSILNGEQQELKELLAASVANNSFSSPKLEKACI